MTEIQQNHNQLPQGVPPQEAGCARLLTVASPASCDPATARILRLPEVMGRVGLRRASIYLHVSKGSFPKPISLGARAVGWLESDINRWIAARIEITARRGK